MANLTDWLKGLEKLIAEATKGPWTADYDETGHWEITSSDGEKYFVVVNECDGRPGDFDFIAGSRTELPRAVKMINYLLSIRNCDVDDSEMFNDLQKILEGG